MTCKDCIHFDVCQDLRCGDITNCEANDCGGFFKPKTHFVELPYEIGQTVWEIDAESPFEDDFRIFESKVEKNCIQTTRNMHWANENTIYLTREEAKKVLERISKK